MDGVGRAKGADIRAACVIVVRLLRQPISEVEALPLPELMAWARDAVVLERELRRYE